MRPLLLEVEQFDRWSCIYDEQPNPLLDLEVRYLAELLPDLRGRDVVDIGCGTGRCLSILQTHRPQSLLGLDCSAGMLARAKAKWPHAVLLRADCVALPLRDSSIDIALVSFTISYASDLETFVGEVVRVLRPDGCAYITDVDAETFAELGWRRSFSIGGQHTDLEMPGHAMSRIITAMEHSGLEVVTLLRPSFGLPEKETLIANGKAAEVARIGERAPIFLAQVKKSAAPTLVDMKLSGATVACSAELVTKSGVSVIDDSIHSLRCGRSAPDSRYEVDLTGYMLLPGLINAHDHLEFALFPRLGGNRYLNCSAWAADIHERFRDTIGNYRAVPRETRLWWGAIKNLLAGVTTVCHHNPFEPAFAESHFPIRVVQNYRWAHSLALDPAFRQKHELTPPEQPFIVHLAEGIDQASSNEISTLNEAGGLDYRTVLVHGLALDRNDANLINQRGGSLVLCCSSNEFLFGRHHIANFIRCFERVAIGTDSSLTAEGDLLDEIRFLIARAGLTAREAFAMVTGQSAGVLRLGERNSKILPDRDADMIAIRSQEIAPCELLAHASFRNVEMVMVGGRIQLASPSILERLPADLRAGMEPLEIQGTLRWIRAPIQKLLAQAAEHIGGEISLGGKLVRLVH
jgi:ubiquinone/menaquinone biosynthesis C-methylase UbiE/cytosine/adenosine deaminase-related metal-dependent hydrolase